MSQINRTILLTQSEYVHIINNNTGEVRLIEGPYCGNLEANEGIYGKIENKITLRSNQYCLILNPVKNGKIQEGHREVRRGSQIFALHPGEIIEGGIRRAFSLAENEGLYIRDIKTGSVRLELGPKEVFLEAFEELYEKQLTEVEIKALRLNSDYKKYHAIRIDLDDNEVIQLYDREKIRIEKGPKRIFLQPYERPKVLNLSGSTPKVPGVLTKAKITVGPDFLSDILKVRTKDNAVLNIHVRYKQRFNMDLDNLGKIFLINDFIGFASETLASEIREEAAKHNFEDFHASASEIIRNIVFSGGNEMNRDPTGRTFENGFEIFSVDIKQITPEDPEIASKLNLAISKNMDVYVKKILQTAELEARRQLIEGEKSIEEQRKGLIELKNTNLRHELIEKAKIEARAEVEKAKGLAEADQIQLEASSKAELGRVQQLKDTLEQKGAYEYLKFVEYEAFTKVRKTFIMTSESKMRIPYGKEDS